MNPGVLVVLTSLAVAFLVYTICYFFESDLAWTMAWVSDAISKRSFRSLERQARHPVRAPTDQVADIDNWNDMHTVLSEFPNTTVDSISQSNKSSLLDVLASRSMERLATSKSDGGDSEVATALVATPVARRTQRGAILRGKGGLDNVALMQLVRDERAVDGKAWLKAKPAAIPVASDDGWDYSIVQPNDSQVESKARIEEITTQLMEQEEADRKNGFWVSFISYRRYKKNKPDVWENTPVGYVHVGEVRSDNVWWMIDGVAYSATDPDGKGVTVGYANKGYHAKQYRKECAMYNLLCEAGVSPCVRFCSVDNHDESIMVIDDVGRGLWYEIQEGRYSMIDALYMGVKMMDKVEVLHEQFGFIHGNPQIGNVAFKSPGKGNPKTDEIVLVGFDYRSIFYPDVLLTNYYGPSRKTDVFKIFENIVWMATGGYAGRVSETGDIDFITGKRTWSGYEPFNPLLEYEMPIDDHSLVVEKLKAMGAILNELTSDERPDYDNLRGLMRDCIRILENVATRQKAVAGI